MKFLVLMCVGLGLVSGDDYDDVTDVCCSHGQTSALGLPSTQECSLLDLPEYIEPEQETQCRAAAAGCCLDHFKQKDECAAGMPFAAAKRCATPATDIGKTCCEECSIGTLTGETQGAGACGAPPDADMSPTTYLRKNTYYKCCVEAASRPETTTELPSSTTVALQRCKPGSCDQECDDSDGVVRCGCRSGYRLNSDRKTCKDINECAEATDNLCNQENFVCHNTPGSFKCVPIKKRDVGISCPPGFKRNVMNQVCDDINECQLPRPPCPKYLCENTIGGFKCGGKPGTPMAEGATEPPAAPAPAPKNDICPAGFRAGANDECVDIDECEEHLDDCQRLSQHCINTHGAFFCQDHVSKRCSPGFKVNTATGICEDIDECEESSEVCRRNQVCVNLPGAYDCKSKISTLPRLTTKQCQEGTRMRVGSTICEDIDECREGTHLCDRFQNCINTFGGHECRCKPGFELDSSSGSCVDIDECALRLDDCGGLHCLNVLGSFTCSRRPPTTSPAYEYEYYDSDEDNTTNTLPEATTTTSTTSRPRPIPSRTLPPRPTLPAPRPTPPTPRPTPPTPRPTPPTTRPTPRTPRPTPSTPRPTPSTPRPTPPAPTTTTPRPTTLPPTTPPTTSTTTTTITPQPTTTSTNTTVAPRRTPPQYNPYGRPYTNRPRPSYTTTTQPSRLEPRPELPTVDVPAPTDPIVVERERGPDGGYELDTGDIPTDRWTNVVGRENPDFNVNDLHCLDGYERNELGECVDVDECTGRHTCSALETCQNELGSFRCECVAGFRRDRSGACAVIPPPATRRPPSRRPTTSTTSTTTVAPTTSDSERPYSPPPRSNSPQFCEMGYAFNSNLARCADIDECSINRHTCTSNERCINVDGGYRCERSSNAPRPRPDSNVITVGAQYGQRGPRYQRPAYSRLPGSGAVLASCPWGYRRTSDNMCLGAADCSVITVGAQYGQRGPRYRRPAYSRLPGSGAVVALCPWGYRRTPDNLCLDIDECTHNSSDCGPAQRCENFPGGYSCQCPAGHRLQGQTECEDIDECSYGVPCSYTSQCINTVGSYRCECNTGFRNAPANDKVCVDIDECSETPEVCEQGCTNSWGSYRCYCRKGYKLDTDGKSCVDVDECAEWGTARARGRLCSGACVNEPGSYRCSCPAGYRLSEDQHSCIDIDECETGTATCAHSSDQSEVCQNTRGSYHCHTIRCPGGYQLEAKHRCSRVQRSCPAADWGCLHQPSSYSYNFITFVAHIYLPAGSVDLFTMHGPMWSESFMSFEMRLVDVQAAPGVRPAELSCFDTRPMGNMCVVSLLCSLEGPQVAELELTMSLYQRGQFAGSAVARLVVIVSQYEY